MADAPAINIGVIQTGGKAAKRKASSNRTILVTGIARSGTSMVAAVLRAAGLHMGDFVHDVVHEDGQMQEILQSRDTAMLRRLIGQRNTQHKQWGFKLPSLHTLMRHDEVGLFRNPHLIATRWRSRCGTRSRNMPTRRRGWRTRSARWPRGPDSPNRRDVRRCF